MLPLQLDSIVTNGLVHTAVAVAMSFVATQNGIQFLTLPLPHRVNEPLVFVALDGINIMSLSFLILLRVLCADSVADPGFSRGGGANSPGGHQHTILPNFPKNCMKLKEFGPRGVARIQNFTM